MRHTEPLRLSLLALLVVVLQLAWYLASPGTRATVDFYVIFLLLATAACGVPLGGALAVAGGALMDIYSVELPAFHVFYYLIPVAIGAQLRVHMLTQFRLLGALALVLLVLGKVVCQLVLLIILGRLDSPVYLLRISYWPLVAVAIVVYALWPWLVRLFPRPTEVRSSGH